MEQEQNQAQYFSSGLGSRSSILAIVPYFYKYEPWLAQGLESLIGQSHAPDNIVVVDDASPEPPSHIVRRFPQVTLLASRENVGMYRLSQQVVATTDYDGYLFQDADDWSTSERLAALLAEAERRKAEMAGCQQERIYEGVAPGFPVRLPLDCNSACFGGNQEYPLPLTTSVISRALIERLGGFAGGLRYAADAEFVRRAIFIARVVNTRERYYYRRVHTGAATVNPDTGRESPLRKTIHQ